MQTKWLIKTPIEKESVEELRSKLKVDRIVADLLLQRGISEYKDAQNFFRPTLDGLHDPFLMKDLAKAVDRINLAIQNSEKILLFGDYDVDGTTAVALLYTVLKNHYSEIDFYIPDRYSEGYGVSLKGIDFAKENNFKLIISLDCGIRSVKEVEYSNSLGIDFIVCDHHNPGQKVPDCIVLDPKQLDCSYPFKELSGCGVGFKLLQGLFIKNGWSTIEIFQHLDLLALSIGADIVPVVGENRILCSIGLNQLNKEPKPAFKELLTIAKREFPINLTDVVFIIAPRINAAGRLRSGRHAVELMISQDLDEIRNIAREIDEDNQERRKLDQKITAEALELIDLDIEFTQRKSTVVFKSDWHKGVVGIVASRLIEKHFRPTIVLTESNGKATGSARTVNNFDIHAALIECEHLLDQFGGHTHAAGMTLSIENVPSFQLLFDEVVSRTLRKEDELPEIQVDLELSFNEIFLSDEDRMRIPRLKRILDQFEPYGPGNMKPLFLATNVYSTDVRILKDQHLKLTMTQPDSDLIINGIGFNLAEKEYMVASGLPYDIVFTLESNKWNNRETLQLNIKDIRPTV